MKKIDYCYHTHTYRCGHAEGNEEEYILAAIDTGIKELGFSDHVFLPGVTQPGIRGDFSLLNGYIESLKALKEKYRGKINIHIGFECEYYPEYVSYYRDLKEKYGVEYLILGQHCYLENNAFKWYLSPNCSFDRIKKYTDDLIKGMKTGLFSYVAHPDLFVCPYQSFNKGCIRCAERICKAAEKYRVPLEINLGKIVKRELFMDGLNYPCEEFWAIAGKYDIDVIVGVDAHSPRKFYDANYDYALRLVDKYNLRLVDRLKK